MFAPPSINLPNLESYYNFNAGSGNILFDQSGNGNHGNIHGATWSDDGAPTHPTAFALISVDSVEAINSSSVSVPINIDLMGESMSSVEIRFSGFQDQIAFLDVDTVGTLLGAAGWNIQVNEQEDLLITGSYGSTEISENGILFRLKFEIPAQTDIDFIPVDITSAEIDEIDGEISYLNGGIDILDILWGDVSQNNDVSLYDAALVLKYLVGSESFNDIQLSIADVTQDSSISALDATVIAQYAVEIIDSLPAGDEQNLNTGGAFVINEDEFIPGSILEIPIVLSNGRNLLSFEMDIAYEPEMISFENITWSEMIGHFTIEENIENGSINIAGMGTTPDGQDGVFGTINLFVSSRFNEESIELTMNRYRINESDPAILRNGTQKMCLYLPQFSKKIL